MKLMVHKGEAIYSYYKYTKYGCYNYECIKDGFIVPAIHLILKKTCLGQY